ncbi:MAG: lipopolysaccharide biosynthesis protein [Mycobacteriales bacterium]
MPADPAVAAGPARAPRAGQGASAALASRLSGRLLGLVLVVFLARRESTRVFASYNYLLVLAAAVGLVTDLGVASVAGREVARGELTVAQAIRGGAGVQTLTSLFAGAAVLAFGLLVPGPGASGPAVASVAALTSVTGWFDFQAELLRGAGRPWVEAAIQLLGAMLQVGLGLWVILTHGSLALLLAVQVIRQLAVCAVSQVFLPWPWSAPPDRSIRRQFLQRGLWLGAATTCTAVVWRFAQLVIGAIAPVSQVAYYALASRYFEIETTAAHTLGVGLLPALSRRAQRANAGRGDRLGRGLSALLAGASLAAVAGAAAAPTVTIAVFGAKFRPAGLPSQVFVLAFPILLAFFLLYFLLVAERAESAVMGSAVAGLVAAAAVVPVLIETPSATVGAWTTVTAVAVATIAMAAWLLTRQARRRQRGQRAAGRALIGKKGRGGVVGLVGRPPGGGGGAETPPESL